MVKRFTMNGDRMFPAKSGQWMTAEDYDALAARLAEANALLREARDKHWPFMATDGLAARIDAHLARKP
jgi:hypothetical protein